LAALERELAKMDLLTDYHTGMSGERFFSIWSVDFLKHTGDFNPLFGPMGADGADSDFGNQITAGIGKNVFHLIPSGWFEQNKLSLGRLHVDYLLPLVDAEKQLVSPALSREGLQHATDNFPIVSNFDAKISPQTHPSMAN
jgi:hypothetical protein